MYFTVEYGPTQRPNMVLLFMIIASTKTQLPRGGIKYLEKAWGRGPFVRHWAIHPPRIILSCRP